MAPILLPFCSGGFLYLSFVSLLASVVNKDMNFKARVANFLVFIAGFAVMMLLENLGDGHHHHHGGGHGHDHDHDHDHSHVHQRRHDEH